MSDESITKFIGFKSFVDSTYWHVLTNKILREYKLNEGPHSIYGYFEHIYSVGSSNKMMLDMDSFEKRKYNARLNQFYLKGNLWTLNTTEAFQKMDKNQFLIDLGRRKIGPLLENDGFLRRPDKLCRFSVVSYSDLKKYIFYYWFAFPAPVFPTAPIESAPLLDMNSIVNSEQAQLFTDLFAQLMNEKKSMFFSVFIKDGAIRLDSFLHFDINDENCILGFCDPSCEPNTPGWPLRLILFAICNCLIPDGETRQIRVLSYMVPRSISAVEFSVQPQTVSSIRQLTLTGFRVPTEEMKFVGWEKYKNQLMPKSVNLSASLDPIKLAENAVDLNLRLMKWRLMPSLQLNTISSTKCLLLGAGTLGCNVARQLLAWNVGQITLVDNGRVAYSNPVRQSLFTFEHSKRGDMNKAQAAADTLKAIYPGVKVSHHNLTIPMPGHSVSKKEVESIKEAVHQLDLLVMDHDVVFLLLDTREARWLPTVLACLHRKLVINAALGFDTYMVMRHGVCPDYNVSPSGSQDIVAGRKGRLVTGHELGCYFCTDVVGPANSTRDRSLDQQCTVTRPGVSMVAAGLAVELMVSVLQHPHGSKCPATSGDDIDEADSCMGSTPHQMRGFLSSFSCVPLFHQASVHCTACSQLVLDEFSNRGFEFLLKVFNEHDYLEKVAGLTDMHMSIDLDSVTALSDSDSI